MNYLDHGDMHTSYLKWIKLVAADSSVVYNALVSNLRACKIDVSKRLKKENPYMLNMHCIAYKLALSSLDTAKSEKEVSYYAGMLHALHSFLSR